MSKEAPPGFLVANAGDSETTLSPREPRGFGPGPDRAGGLWWGRLPKAVATVPLWCTCLLGTGSPARSIALPEVRPPKNLLPVPVAMATGRLGVEETLGALNAALGAGCPVWFKETRARHLRARDFLAPRRALQARFEDGQVPEAVVHAVVGLQGPGVAPVLRCEATPSGLALQLQRSAVFERVLGSVAAYATPAAPAARGPRVILHCPSLRAAPCTLRLCQLRAVLVADHLAQALRVHGVRVSLVPAVRDPHMSTLLQQLRVDWPSASEPAPTEALWSRALAEFTSAGDRGALPPGVLGSVCLKELVEGRGRSAGYDPNLDSCLVTEDLLSALAELQAAVQRWPEDSSPGLAAALDAGVDSCTVVHVVSYEEEFQQQKLDLLWWKLDDGAPLRQKHVVCGPVKVAGVPGTLTAPEYYELRHAQVCKASALKHSRDLAQDPAWAETFRVLSVATIKFEMLSKAPQSQGEWLLLFNGVLPFPDLLHQTAALDLTAPGLRMAAHTEMVCKFLVQLSMDFSSYYNRVHVLTEPRPHLFGQMLARLQLLRAVREVLHAGLALLGLPPLSHI
ncbi:DALR anticodon-binding domain-containing protein 3 isoform X2 [Phyllostomus hastatus]|uniref:DALR anticodon-binding domain-containing protein 3 isoform X2 n=1 Tax=Phyllostomus hastatus TaxID=9423 RepID=UPI001E6852E3|nr:DALR anticodon-binding domain-containing protein 3 isoform X2 [Phyllostomus hastatus]